MARKARELSRTGAWSLILLFLIALVVPTTFGALKIQVSTPKRMRLAERRLPNRAPRLPKTVKAVQQFPDAAERWYNDWFGLRPVLIRSNGLLHYSMLGTAPDSHKVLVGRDGWLFLGDTGVCTVQQSRGLYPMPPKLLRRRVNAVVRRKEWLAARGIPFVFVVAPDKSAVYTEFMPAWAQCKVGPTPLEQLSRSLATKDVHFLDLTDALVAAKSECVTYYKTDTHWNDFGAWVGYRTLMDYLREQELGAGRYRDLSEDPCQVQRGPVDPNTMFGLIQQLGLDRRDLQDEVVRVVPAAPVVPVDIYSGTGELLSSGPNETIWRWQHVREVRWSDAKPDELRVMVLRDSFTNALSPLLNQTFGHVLYCTYDDVAGQEMTAMVERFKPDLVLFIMVQRLMRRPGNGIVLHPNWSAGDGLTPRERFEAGAPVTALNARQLARKIARVRKMPRPGLTGDGLRFRVRGGVRSSVNFRRLVGKSANAPYVLRLEFEPGPSAEALVDAGRGVHSSGLLMPGERFLYLCLPRGAVGKPLRLQLAKPRGRAPDRALTDYVLKGIEIRRCRPAPRERSSDRSATRPADGG